MNWPVIWPEDTPADIEPALKTRAEILAVQTLRILTLGQVGGNTITVMPRRNCNWAWGYWLDTRWFSGVYPAAAHLKNEEFWKHEAIVLDGPVGAVYEVVIDGVVVPPEQYGIEDGDKLVRRDGSSWPRGGRDTFTVKYLQGFRVDLMGQYVAGVLALEFYKSVKKPGNCRLPKNITSINREGLTYEISTAMFPNNSTGITEVDTYVWQWNPNALRVKPTVHIPRSNKPKKVSWMP